jgi:hypothetical protein
MPIVIATHMDSAGNGRVVPCAGRAAA